MLANGELAGYSPSILYNKSVLKCKNDGSQSVVNGFDVLEISPAVVTFENPLRRIVFSNPYEISVGKQCAKLLWIMSGQADVEFFRNFQHPYALVSDDHETFSAPLGERAFMYGYSDLRGMVYNPVNQFLDAYQKLTENPDTQDAVMNFWNPHYETAAFLRQNQEAPQVLSMMWKIRENRLDCTVFCRKQNIPVDLFRDTLFECGALHELMCSVLSYSKKFSELKIGRMSVMTESMYAFASEMSVNSALEQYNFETDYEPRISLSMDELSMLNEFLYTEVIPFLADEARVLDSDAVDSLMGELLDQYANGVTDEFWNTAIKLALAERLMVLEQPEAALRVIENTDVSSYTAQFLHSFEKHVSLHAADAKTFEDEFGGGSYKRVSEQYAYLVRRQLGETVGENLTGDENVRKYFEWSVAE